MLRQRGKGNTTSRIHRVGSTTSVKDVLQRKPCVLSDMKKEKIDVSSSI